MSDSPPYPVDHDPRLAALQSALEVYAIRFKEQADRIEALEAQIQEDTVRLDEDAAIMEKATVRIEALKAALRACVQYHVKAAADNRAIAAVNQDNALGEDSLTAAIDHDIAAEDIGDIARAALAPEQDK